MSGLTPVYENCSGTVSKDSRESNAKECDAAVVEGV